MNPDFAMISFIVPAHNEQSCLPRTLQAIDDSGCAIGQPYEVIVVDDASTDATAEIARQNGARVVSVSHRQIAATRNSGGRAALGDRLFFIDADTVANPRAVASALRYMDKGAVGGGAPTRIHKNEPVPLYVWPVLLFSVPISKLIGFTGGAFMFSTREAFLATGGFNERLYWGEEGSFALRLKREGRFVVLWQSVLTSGRRFRKITGLQLLAGGVRMIFSPVKMLTQRSLVEKIWYDSNRADDHIMPNSLAVRISNGIASLVLLAMFSGPLWDFIPRSLTPFSSPLGKLRLIIGIFQCHFGLILWPVGLILLVNLLRQKRPTALFQSTALIAFSIWQAWGSTLGVVWVWKQFYSLLA
jgi:glycosyltransferase involved in cell wall biosynthesis